MAAHPANCWCRLWSRFHLVFELHRLGLNSFYSLLAAGNTHDLERPQRFGIRWVLEVPYQVEQTSFEHKMWWQSQSRKGKV